MRIALRHRARLVTEKSLHLVQIDSALHQPRGECVPHIVETKVGNAGSIASLAKLLHQISKHKSGTTITLRRLRRRWTAAGRGRFLAEVQTFRAPDILRNEFPKSFTSGDIISALSFEGDVL